ncbi:ATP synthase subunit delta [Ceratobasidium theobromae]|uniref:ATP synthase subunit delta, mitochondrial n=1 Tax=Ceratobasidium theobromae TaxID=1582974 RepID=A0A5N5QTU1_9AGAM|nr:ATP synthase subunit delta [Ceratobasidium theobromae]
MSAFVRTAASSLRAATSRNVARQGAYIQRRGYADAPNDTLKLSLVLPHQVPSIFASANVVQVNIAAESGDMGILANHVPTVEPLRPGVVEVIESGSGSKKWFVSSGFATVHPNNSLTINAIEAAPLEDISPEAVRANLTEALRVVGGNASEAEKAEARIEADVYEAIQQALSK